MARRTVARLMYQLDRNMVDVLVCYALASITLQLPYVFNVQKHNFLYTFDCTIQQHCLHYATLAGKSLGDTAKAPHADQIVLSLT